MKHTLSGNSATKTPLCFQWFLIEYRVERIYVQLGLLSFKKRKPEHWHWRQVNSER